MLGELLRAYIRQLADNAGEGDEVTILVEEPAGVEDLHDNIFFGLLSSLLSKTFRDLLECYIVRGVHASEIFHVSWPHHRQRTGPGDNTALECFGSNGRTNRAKLSEVILILHNLTKTELGAAEANFHVGLECFKSSFLFLHLEE